VAVTSAWFCSLLRSHIGQIKNLQIFMVVEGLTCKTPSGETLRVREVWQENLEEEFDLIRDIVDEYPFVAMDTEFPGVVARPVGNFKNSGEYHFQTLRYASAA